MTNQRLLSLLSRMTLTEKLGQMFSNHAPTDENLKLVEKGKLGTILNPGHGCDGDLAAVCNKFQRVAVEKSRLGIPLFFGRDVIHGYRNVLPIPLAQAASFDEALIERGARAAAVEARRHGQTWAFAPMVDLSRDPRWGRIAESGGEEPEMNARMGAALTRGFQSAGIAACAKHFVGYGAAEGGRDYNTTWIPENHLRNAYLPSFHACVKAGVKSVMSAFNDLNGIHASGNAFTIRHILKDEWGFKGLVVSDWASVYEMITHGFAADPADAARIAIAAGVDMEMVTTTYADNVEALLASGAITMEMIDDATLRVLRVKNELGLFENPYIDEAGENAPELVAESRACAYQLALESCVLLKNEGMLPLVKADGT
ncbi:MAG: glycosyl hydrolase, partial [Kiritimatiellaeota bacterium]|nr:glycosyl hydrolase [Kiritimatiellota bacterium]